MPNNNEKSLPQFAPAVQPSLPGELMVVTEKVDAQGARLRLVPKPSAMDTALNLACASTLSDRPCSLLQAQYLGCSFRSVDRPRCTGLRAVPGGVQRAAACRGGRQPLQRHAAFRLLA